jgi:hypothetical protein
VETVAERHGDGVRGLPVGIVEQVAWDGCRYASSCEARLAGGEALEAVIFVGLQGAGKSSFYG